MTSEYCKIYKRSGLNCVDLNGTCTYLPDNLELLNVKYINGEPHARVATVNISV